MSLTIEPPTSRSALPCQLTQLAVLTATLFIAGYIATAAITIAGHILAGAPLDWSILITPAAGVDEAITLGLIAAVLLVEIVLLGWGGCSLRHLLDPGHTETRSDLLWFLIELSGIYRALMLVGSIGAASLIEAAADLQPGWRMAENWPLWLAFPVMLLTAEFCQYWQHRFQHTAWFWPFHAMHHAARELTPLTSSRSHPMDVFLTQLTTMVVPGLLWGMRADVMFLVSVVSTVAGAITHARFSLPDWAERWFVIGPRLHHIHHSVAVEHRDTNFGTVVPWFDLLFGTFRWGTGEPVTTGVADFAYDTRRPLRDMINGYRVWIGTPVPALEPRIMPTSSE